MIVFYVIKIELGYNYNSSIVGAFFPLFCSLLPLYTIIFIIVSLILPDLPSFQWLTWEITHSLNSISSVTYSLWRESWTFTDELEVEVMK